MPKLSNNCFKYIERCFLRVAESKNFLELDYALIKKILSSSELHITSELEIMKIADSWLRHDYNQRSKFAKDLFLTVRLPLLSMSVLKKVLGRSYNTRNSTVFQSNDECLEISTKIFENREEFFRDRPKHSYKTRYCSQEKFSILVCEGFDETIKEYGEKTDPFIKKVDAENFDKCETIVGFSGCSDHWSVDVASEIYVLTKPTTDTINIDKFSNEKKAWVNVKVINTSRDYFRVCSL